MKYFTTSVSGSLLKTRNYTIDLSRLVTVGKTPHGVRLYFNTVKNTFWTRLTTLFSKQENGGCYVNIDCYDRCAIDTEYETIVTCWDRFKNSKLKSEQLFRESQLFLQRQIIYAISTGLVLKGIMAWFL